MENSTPFDLDQALCQWRTSLQNLGGLRPDELEELEGHLHESISALHVRGLPVQEAFLIATRRLGSERQLSDEFAKANPQRTWTERAMWMVAGMLVAYTLFVVTAPVSGIVLNCAIWSGLNEQVVGALHFLTRWIVWAGAAAIACWIVNRHYSWFDRSVQACIQRPVLSGLGLFIGLECLQYGTRYVTRLAEPLFNLFSGHHGPLSEPNRDVIDQWIFWGYFLTQLLWIAAGPLLAGYAWRRRERSMSKSSVSYEVHSGEDEAARTLQGQGLSRDEAGLVLARRRGHQEVGAQTLGLAISRGIWLERAVWMVTGVALSHCLESLVLSPGWGLAVATQPVALLAQHLAGLASACLGLMLAGTIIAGLWQWVTRHPGQSASIGSVCRHRPFLSAIVLVMVCAGIGFGEYGLYLYAAKQLALPAQISAGPIVGAYFTYSGALTSLVIPIALLLWLARRWRSFQTDPASCR